MTAQIIPFAAPHVKRRIVIANDNDTPPPIAPIGLTRRQIAEYIEILVEVLDAMDGDCDLEDNGDSEEDDFREINGYYILPPEYGIDQTAGILNETAIFRNEDVYFEIEHQLARREVQ